MSQMLDNLDTCHRFVSSFFCSLGVQLHQSSAVDIKTVDNMASITLKAAHKEHEGVYTARLRTWDEIQEHSAFVYVKGEDQHERGFYVTYNCTYLWSFTNFKRCDNLIVSQKSGCFVVSSLTKQS